MATAAVSSDHQVMDSEAFTGQVKVALYINNGILTVHVLQGRYLQKMAKSSSFDTFIKLSVTPDQTRRTFCMTDVKHDTDNPIYDQKFSFETSHEDLDKRVLLSMWQLNMSTRRSHLLGCMAFPLRQLADTARGIRGWFYLLNEKVGLSTFLPVEDTRNDSSSEPETPVVKMQKHRLIIKRGVEGYGFSLKGASPVSISKLTEGASAAGLRLDDVINRVNGENVSGSPCTSVARIIRHCRNIIVLEVLRVVPEPATPEPEAMVVESAMVVRRTEEMRIKVQIHSQDTSPVQEGDISFPVQPEVVDMNTPEVSYNSDHSHIHDTATSCSDSPLTQALLVPGSRLSFSDNNLYSNHHGNRFSICSSASTASSCKEPINMRARLPSFITKLRAGGKHERRSSFALIEASLPSLRMKGLCEEARASDFMDLS